MDSLINLSALEAAGLGCRSSIYRMIKNGTWTPPVKCGVRSSRWPDSEVDALTKARIAGFDDDALRELVKQLLAKRGTAVAAIQRLSGEVYAGQARFWEQVRSGERLAPRRGRRPAGA